MAIKDRIIIYNKDKIEDSRGWFLKVLNGKERSLPKFIGEIYLTDAKPYEIRGGHYHIKTNEWFFLIKGKCTLKLFDLADKTYQEIELNSKVPQTVFVPAKVAHQFYNTSSNEDFILLAYSDRLYEPNDTVKYLF